MCDSASSESEEEENVEMPSKTVVIPGDSGDEVQQRQPRKRASAAAAGIRDELAEVVEDEIPERSPTPEVTMPDSFGSSICSKPLDPHSIRSIVNSQNEVSSSICAPESSETTTAPTIASTSSQSVVESENTTEPEFTTVDPESTKSPFIMLGVKKTSKDKFFKLDSVLKHMNAKFVECTFSLQEGGFVEPAPFELHKLVFSTQAAINTMIEEAFPPPFGLVELVKKCLQVQRVKQPVEGTSESTTVEVCLFLQIDPVIVSGLPGEQANVERFTTLRDEKFCKEAGLVIALDKKIVEKIAKSQEAHQYLHSSAFHAFSGKRKLGKNKPTHYCKFDELPMGDNREEHESFLFKLVETKPAVKRAPKTPSVSKSTSCMPKPKNNNLEMFSAPPTPQRVNTSVVLHNTENDPTKSADDEQKEKWASVGAAINANDGVVKPAQPWAPTMLQLDMPFEKLQVVRGGDGKPILMVYP